MPSSEATTKGVCISVDARYAPAQSAPGLGQWFFLYRVTIRNVGQDTVQLLSRHWVITNGHGETSEVRGPGVVGQHPELAPGQEFSYTSGCPLDTTTGTMHGSYRFRCGQADDFDATIAPFALTQTGWIN